VTSSYPGGDDTAEHLSEDTGIPAQELTGNAPVTPTDDRAAHLAQDTGLDEEQFDDSPPQPPLASLPFPPD
jgi:hypothetical protein